jgi:hypothetical protein
MLETTLRLTELVYSYNKRGYVLQYSTPHDLQRKPFIVGKVVRMNIESSSKTTIKENES